MTMKKRVSETVPRGERSKKGGEKYRRGKEGVPEKKGFLSLSDGLAQKRGGVTKGPGSLAGREGGHSVSKAPAITKKGKLRRGGRGKGNHRKEKQFPTQPSMPKGQGTVHKRKGNRLEKREGREIREKRSFRNVNPLCCSEGGKTSRRSGGHEKRGENSLEGTVAYGRRSLNLWEGRKNPGERAEELKPGERKRWGGKKKKRVWWARRSATRTEGRNPAQWQGEEKKTEDVEKKGGVYHKQERERSSPSMKEGGTIVSYKRRNGLIGESDPPEKKRSQHRVV